MSNNFRTLYADILNIYAFVDIFYLYSGFNVSFGILVIFISLAVLRIKMLYLQVNIECNH